jgi:hypothetical protein
VTQDERREQKVRLRIDLEDEENNLNHLRERARHRGELISQFGKWLINTPEIHIYRDSSSIHGGLDVMPLQDKHVEALQLQPSLLIANEIRESMAKIRDLKERLEKLG